MSKFLIIGLGNPGPEYNNTRHNIGFTILDELANEAAVFFQADRLASVATFKAKGKPFVLIKPSTFMNLSGKAVNYWMQTEKVSKENILVVTDDLALPLGTIRIKGKGSDGGHNGLKSIQETLGTGDYPRLRFGIGNEFAKGKQSDYVLGQWTPEEEKVLPERIKLAAEAVKSFGLAGIERAMTSYNSK